MASSRSGKALSSSNLTTEPPMKESTNPSASSKKRKASEALLSSQQDEPRTSPMGEDNKENVDTKRALTPPSSRSTEPTSYERTPGRVGPIKKDDFSLTPTIKPFKGPPGKKVRKTAWEKDQEYRQFGLENEGHCFHELYVCYNKGPNGSPTYDKSGFELDYHKVARWMEPKAYNKSAIVRGSQRAVDRSMSEGKRMAEIFFEKGEAPTDTHYSGYWKDRVSKDLNVPWHKVGVEEFEIWEKKGFKKARKGEYENFSQEEKDRYIRLLSGASLRK